MTFHYKRYELLITILIIWPQLPCFRDLISNKNWLFEVILALENTNTANTLKNYLPDSTLCCALDADANNNASNSVLLQLHHTSLSWAQMTSTAAIYWSIQCLLIRKMTFSLLNKTLLKCCSGFMKFVSIWWSWMRFLHMVTLPDF